MNIQIYTQKTDYKIDLDMKEEEYISSMIKSMKDICKSLNYNINIFTFSEYTEKQLYSGIHDKTFDACSQYCNYIDSCYNFLNNIKKKASNC